MLFHFSKITSWMKKWWHLLILLLIGLLTHIKWSGLELIFTHGDWWYFDKLTQSSLLSKPFIWTYSGLGSPNIGISSYPINLIWGILGQVLKNPFPLSEKVIFFLPIIIFGNIFIYLFLKKSFKSFVAITTGVIIYNLNTYFLMLQTGHLTLALAFSFAPIFIYFYQKTVANKSIFCGVVCGLAGFILGAFEFRALYITFLVCGILLFFHMTTSSRKLLNDKFELFRLFFYGALPLFIILLLNLYWFIPSLITGSITSNSFFSRSLFGQQFSLITYPLTLFHPFWTNSSYESFVIQPIPWYAWITPILFSITIYIRKKHKTTLFFATIAIVGIFLSKHLNPPFGFVYQWLYSYLPGFNAFRESSKFYFLIMLGYAGTTASLLEYLNNKFSSGLKRLIPWSLLIISILPFLINSKPLITGEIGTLFVPRSVPEDYRILNDYIHEDSSFYRTLWVPTQSRWGSYSNFHPIVSISELVYKYSETIFSQPIASIEIGKKITQLISDDKFSQILNLSKIKYVIVPLRDTGNDDDFFVNFGENREIFIQTLDAVPSLSKLDIGTKEVVIFKNNDLDKNKLITIYPELDSEIKIVRPTTINIYFDSLQYPVNLVFSQANHPGWQLRSSDEEVVIKKITDTNFNQIFSNSFEIYPADGENNNIELQLVFKPQLLVDKYVVVSFLSFLVCLFYLIIRINKK